MGTFHDNLGELHGITVVVETADETTYVGRFHEMNEKELLLLDGDLHEAKQTTPSKAEFLQRAFQFGVWKKFSQKKIPSLEIQSIRKLGELTGY